ncbi:Gfo/Idh/MocA family oxidoreductase [Nocardioides sp. NPDC000445]|uniref:Gfo/Idh/MocA family protein n=1 Tax=Nocardioides sp. NPDC000445 TaxID=3154257 RepID=UPI00332F03B9
MAPHPPPERDPHPGYSAEMPKSPRPIVLVGAGGIVRDAHLPAYAKAGFEVASITDLVPERARDLAEQYGIRTVCADVADAVRSAPADAVYDVALPPEAHVEVLEQLPDGAAVLLQKPLGNHLAEGIRTREVCRRKGLVAAVNTQLRFAPYVVAARELIAAGTIGELYDLEVRVSVRTPWEMFPYVLDLDRLEINMHSVHYLDLVRSFLGDPTGVHAVTVRHPEKAHANSRSDIALSYGDRPIRVVVSTNHDHHYGPRHEESFVKWEGTRGAIRAQLGLLLDYPPRRGGLARARHRRPARRRLAAGAVRGVLVPRRVHRLDGRGPAFSRGIDPVPAHRGRGRLPHHGGRRGGVHGCGPRGRAAAI